MPRLDKNPRGFLIERGGGEEWGPPPAEHNRYTPEEATRRDRINSAMVSYMYLHWLQTGAPRHLSAVAFRDAVKRGDILQDVGSFPINEAPDTQPPTLLSAQPSTPGEGN